MTYATIDRREAYYERAAKSIAADPLGFYCRAEAGRRVQANVKPKDYRTPERKPVLPANVYPMREQNRTRALALSAGRNNQAG